MEIQVQAVYMRKQIGRWGTSCVELLFLLQSSALIMGVSLKVVGPNCN